MKIGRGVRGGREVRGRSEERKGRSEGRERVEVRGRSEEREGREVRGGRDPNLALTANTDPPVEVIQLLCAEGHLDPAPTLHVGGTTGLGDHLLAALVHIGLAVSALHTLPHDATEHTATVITPGRGQVRLCLKLVGFGLLQNQKVNTARLVLRNNSLVVSGVCACMHVCDLRHPQEGWFPGR